MVARSAQHFRIAPEEESDRTAVRAPGAGVQNSAVFCARSASAGGGTRYFSQCLIFWCFWIKPKARKKENVQQKKSILREEFRREDRLRRICGSEPAEARRWGRAPQCCGG